MFTAKVAELREACTAKGLDATGTKAVLVARLEGGGAAPADPAAPAASAPAAGAAPADEEPATGRPVRKGRGKAAAAAAPAGLIDSLLILSRRGGGACSRAGQARKENQEGG